MPSAWVTIALPLRGPTLVGQVTPTRVSSDDLGDSELADERAFLGGG